MDITKFVLQGRERALLYGDHATYHARLARRLLNSRKKLAIATRNRGKFQKKDAVTAENVSQNLEYVHLLLLTSERAWAQALSIKSSHANSRTGIVGRTRSHIVSRLDKAARTAEHLVQVLSETEVSHATTRDILEAKAYAALLHGAMYFEKQSWEPCLRNYAIARVVCKALVAVEREDTYKDLLADTIDPSLRYAAYQLKTPRTVPIPVIARNAFPRSDDILVQQVSSVDPGALSGESDANAGIPNADNVPKSITWRSRKVQIEDAQIALAWAAVISAKQKLTDDVRKQSDRVPQQAATLYDEILAATQEAVDATKQAIDELRSEGVGQSDIRMQSLQIIRTAVNYEMISWRIGRNRVLTGSQDGAVETYSSDRKTKKAKDAKKAEGNKRELPTSRKLTKLKEKVALYDGALQNLDSMKDLPGVAADEELSAKLDAYVSYFKALKSLSIARSHAIVDNVQNALALIQHAYEQCQEASNIPKDLASSQALPLNVEVTPTAIASLTKLVDGELQRHRAIVHIENIRKSEGRTSKADKLPIIERLHDFPAHGVDLDNIVEIPPQKAFIPMKPIFLDVAWNYIEYPGKIKSSAVSSAAPVKTSEQAQQPAQTQQQKRGWFGFGR